MARALTAALLAALLVAGGARAAPESRLTLPSGFRIEEFASGFGPTRFMTIDPTGTLLVSTPGRGRVVALPDRNRDGRADTVVTVAEGLELPHGLAFKDGQLYVAETGRVRRFRYDPATLKASDPTVVVPNLPPGGGHWTRTIAFGRDGRLYVSVGSSCNVCTERDPRRAAITRYNADGSGEARFATGLRNAVGLAFHPETGELWATVNERDWRGDDLPPDYITEVKDGAFYGWPDCFAVGGRAVVDRGANGSAERCGRMTLPTIEIQGHSAPLGLAFYTGAEFPPAYRGSLFVAYHGSWNRSVPTGYKVVRVPFKGGRPSGPVEDFATGWREGGSVRGPAGGTPDGRRRGAVPFDGRHDLPDQLPRVLVHVGGPDMAPRTPQRSEAPRETRGAPRSPLLLALRADRIPHTDHAFGENSRAQPAAVDEAGQDPLLRELLEVLAGLAESRADQEHRTHPELMTDQVVERHAGRRDVAAGLRRGELDAEPAPFGVLHPVEERRDRLRLDQRHLTAAVARMRRVRAGLEEIAVTREAAPRHRLHGFYGLHRRGCFGGDVERDDASLPHGRDSTTFLGPASPVAGRRCA